MINSILINKQFFLLIDFVTLCFAFWVYFSDKKSRLNQNFSLMTFLIFLWITFGYLTASATQPNLALFWAKLAYGSVSLFFIPFYFFFLYFLNLEKKNSQTQ
ncbi:hypothetical protein KKA72_01195 [Patescibacteria group bacterium]|nr:hypothetical protein [Patescibacteria group bacterium]MBU1876947.1 hypothetical protein [Patescibacteria group bacterium]